MKSEQKAQRAGTELKAINELIVADDLKRRVNETSDLLVGRQ